MPTFDCKEHKDWRDQAVDYHGYFVPVVVGRFVVYQGNCNLEQKDHWRLKRLDFKNKIKHPII